MNRSRWLLYKIWEKICEDSNIDYRKIKSREVFDLNKSNVSEDDYLETQYVYIDILKEMLRAYLNKPI